MFQLQQLVEVDDMEMKLEGHSSASMSNHNMCTIAGYLENGLLVKDCRKLVVRYIKSAEFRLDLLSVLPFDLFYFAIGLVPAVRLNRLLRFPRLREFFDRTVRQTRWEFLVASLLLLFFFSFVLSSLSSAVAILSMQSMHRLLDFSLLCLPTLIRLILFPIQS